MNKGINLAMCSTQNPTFALLFYFKKCDETEILFDNDDEDDDKSINKIINVRGRETTLEEFFV